MGTAGQISTCCNLTEYFYPSQIVGGKHIGENVMSGLPKWTAHALTLDGSSQLGPLYFIIRGPPGNQIPHPPTPTSTLPTPTEQGWAGQSFLLITRRRLQTRSQACMQAVRNRPNHSNRSLLRWSHVEHAAQPRTCHWRPVATHPPLTASAWPHRYSAWSLGPGLM